MRRSPLSLRTAHLFKQRFNVAASRARDQMWVVHSLEPRTDLKPDDLRRRLIEHAADPYMVTNAIEVMAKRVESDFEREVAQRLIQAGYRVIPQWKVGHYRIDLVIEGSMKRLAVECDGERFHPHEKLEDDLARQAVLERLGWSFVRIRGSYFYRDRNAALEPLFKRLIELGIAKLGNDTGNVQGPESETELLTRVRRRAEELRRNWQSDPKHRAMGPSLRNEEDDLTPVKVTLMKEGPPPVEEPQSPRIEPVIQENPPGLPFDEELSVETPAQTRSESVGQVGDIGLPDLPVVLQNGQTLPQPGPSSTEGAIVAAVSAKDWFSIAKWAKDNGHLEGWQRSLSFSLGRRAANGTEFSEKQVRQGVRILEEVRRLGTC